MTVRTQARAVKGQDGFTLIELLVVTLIIGILAAIALPSFLDQRKKGHDASAKSNARNMVTAMESCYNELEGYKACARLLDAESTGLPLGNGPGQVRTSAFGKENYRIVATSNAMSSGVNHQFYIEKTLAQPSAHDCNPRGWGGCPDDGAW